MMKYFSLLLLCWAGSAAGIPVIQYWETVNGARVYFVAAPELPIVDVEVIFDAGAARDGEKPGLAAIANGMLAEGAGGRSAEWISEKFSDLGASFGSGVSRDMAWVSLREISDPALLDPALDTLALLLAKPDFPQKAFERERKRMLVGLQYKQQSPDDLAEDAFYASVYPGHPYGTPLEGTEESVSGLTLADLQAFYTKYYVAKNAVVTIVGALDKPAAQSIAAKLARELSPGLPAPKIPQAPELREAKTIHIDHPSSQTHVLLGQVGYSRYDPDYFTLYVGNHILGGSGLVSRLSEEIREKRGLSYSAYSYFAPMRAAGPFQAGLQTRNEQTESAIQLLRDTLRDFIATGPAEEELKASKKNLTGGFPLKIDSNKKILQYIAMIGFYGLPLDYLQTWTDRVNAVSAAQIRDAFKRRIHPQKMLLVTAGGK
ncbi:MAG: insulinase family protein [Gammaproteobacteria bacterium]|nr:insulinase family protein [Gammaproteobacteria bacterium]